MHRLFSFTRVTAALAVLLMLFSPEAALGAQDTTEVLQPGSTTAWWVWPLSLLVLTFLMGTRDDFV